MGFFILRTVLFCVIEAFYFFVIDMKESPKEKCYCLLFYVAFGRLYLSDRFMRCRICCGIKGFFNVCVFSKMGSHFCCYWLSGFSDCCSVRDGCRANGVKKS